MATQWEINNEQRARQTYEFKIAAEHVYLLVVDCGLYVNEKWPLLGASPNGFVFF